MTEAFVVPDDWEIYGDDYPCCSCEGDYDESYDAESGDEWGWWMHHDNPDNCTWGSGDTEPCPRWPHADLVPGRDLVPDADDRSTATHPT